MVLGLVAVIGLLSVGALHDALFGEQLAASRMLHQRAAALADFGIRDGLLRLGEAASPPIEISYAIPASTIPGDSTSVRVRHLASSELPAGFSVAQFTAHHFEIQSTGHTARGVQMTQVQGATRVMPVPARTADEPDAGSIAQGAARS